MSKLLIESCPREEIKSEDISGLVDDAWRLRHKITELEKDLAALERKIDALEALPRSMGGGPRNFSALEGTIGNAQMPNALLIDGSRAMTGNFNLGTHDITNSGNITLLNTKHLKPAMDIGSNLGDATHRFNYIHGRRGVFTTYIDTAMVQSGSADDAVYLNAGISLVFCSDGNDVLIIYPTQAEFPSGMTCKLEDLGGGGDRYVYVDNDGVLKQGAAYP